MASRFIEYFSEVLSVAINSEYFLMLLNRGAVPHLMGGKGGG